MPGSRPAGPTGLSAGTSTIDDGTLARARVSEPGTVGSQPAASNAESGMSPAGATATHPGRTVSLLFRSAC
jgi:hypothetical protein